MNTNQTIEPRHVAIVRAAETSRIELAEAEPIAPVPANFAVVDVKSANWVMRRIMEARAYAEAVQEWADAETARAKREEQFFLLHFGNGLQAVLEEEIEKQKGRRKSVKLPAGTMGYRAEPQRVRVDDEAAAIEWARQHCPDAVRVTERISRTAINEHHAASGEVPNGCAMQPAGERFYIR